MPGLRALQEAFQGRVLGTSVAADALVTGDARAGAAARLDIYADAYRLRLAEVLARDYPALAAHLGDGRFAALAAGYARAHPSSRPSVRWFGGALPEFLGRERPWRDSPALAALARLEQAQGDVSDASDDAVLDIDEVASLSPERWPAMCFRPRAAVRRVDVGWDVAAALRADPQAAPGPLEPLDERLGWLVWRYRTRVRWRSLAPDERDALDACVAGRRFDAICEIVAAHTGGAGDAAMRAASMLKQWIHDELLSRLHLDDDG